MPDVENSVPTAAIWLLQCLIHCTRDNRGAALRDIIAFGDFINHAVFEYTEFRVALSYLAANHIAYVRRGRVFLTKNFKSAFYLVATEQERPTYTKEYAKLERFLDGLQPAKGTRPPPIGKKTFSQALQAYLEPDQE